jgi:7-carboxy-7-deazaguanine synthase
MTLRLTEIFYSLQGEARTVGLPTVFVRLTGCPLRCVYCDTEYAFNGGYLLSLAGIAQQVASHKAHYVTVTGVCPCLTACATPATKSHWKQAVQ